MYFNSPYFFISILLCLSCFSKLTISAPLANSEQFQTQTIPSDFSIALNASLKYHPMIKGQQAQLSQKEFAVDGAKTAKYPSLSLSANSLNENYDEGTLVIEQPLWAFGRIDSTIDIAKANYNVEDLVLLQAKRSLLEDTAIAYASVRTAQYKISISKDNVAEHERLYQSIKRRESGHLASKADVSLAYSRLLQAQAALQQYKSILSVALNELLSLTRIKVATNSAIDEKELQIPQQQLLKEHAIKQSADIAYSRMKLKATKAQLSYEKVAYMPTISFRVERDLLDSNPNLIVDKTRAGFVIAGHLDGLGFTSYNNIEGASAAINAAQYELDNSINEIERRIDNLVINRDLQGNLRTAQLASVAALEHTMSSFLRQYETNRKSWVEVLNTQRELSQLRYSLIDINKQWLDISITLAAIIGQLDALAIMETS